MENNPAIQWCPEPGCERAVRLNTQGPGTSSSDPLYFPLLRAPAVDCGKGHLFCWSVHYIEKIISSVRIYSRCILAFMDGFPETLLLLTRKKVDAPSRVGCFVSCLISYESWEGGASQHVHCQANQA